MTDTPLCVAETRGPLPPRLYDANCMIEGIWPLPMPNAPEALMNTLEYSDEVPAGLAQFVEDWDKSERAELLSGTDGRSAWEALFEEMYSRGASGYLVQSAVPVFERTGDNAASYSWGHYSVAVFFAATIDEALNAAIDDAEAQWDEATLARAGDA